MCANRLQHLPRPFTVGSITYEQSGLKVFPTQENIAKFLCALRKYQIRRTQERTTDSEPSEGAENVQRCTDYRVQGALVLTTVVTESALSFDVRTFALYTTLWCCRARAYTALHLSVTHASCEQKYELLYTI